MRYGKATQVLSNTTRIGRRRGNTERHWQQLPPLLLITLHYHFSVNSIYCVSDIYVHGLVWNVVFPCDTVVLLVSVILWIGALRQGPRVSHVVDFASHGMFTWTCICNFVIRVSAVNKHIDCAGPTFERHCHCLSEL